MERVNTYIISLEGKDIINSQRNKKGYEAKNKNNLFKGSLDYSLEAIKISGINDKLFYKKDGKQYTKAVVNVTFNYGNRNKEITLDLYDDKDLNNQTFDRVVFKYKRENGKKTNGSELAYGLYQHKDMNTKEIREELYKNGFKLDGRQYVRFKRSSGSSRVGKCLFIRKDLYKPIMDWSYMGLKYGKNDKMDLASMEAYISLTTSSIIDTIHIDPKSILVIDDYKSEFEDIVMATEWCEKDKRLKTSKKKTIISNSIWDGQSLLDRSVFDENYSDKGFLLLRNRFFKSACFNTNIQQFFKDNNITQISQLKGFTLATRVEDIKLITTPSSIKYLKFKNYKLFKNDRDTCLKYWLENTESVFGVVKYEKPPTNMHEMVQTHYQLLNTLPLSYKDMQKLLEPSLDYIKLLKDDLAVLRNHIGITMNKMENWNLEDENFDFTNSDEMVYKLLMINDKFADTKIFRKYKDNLIQSYKNNIRKGHILINGNYSVLFGNGYEMLKASCGLFKGVSVLGIDEVSVKSFKYNVDLIGIRSPHVTMGNVLCCKNVSKELIDKYFNSSKFIVHVNSINNNLLEKLSSADFDSDQILITDNKILIDSAKKIYGKFLVPTDFTPKKTTDRTNSVEDKIDLDIKTSKNLIGEIINLSQILNSEYWDRVKKGTSTDGLYEIISQLDVMSCIEIDKAKKESVVDSEMELKSIREGDFISYGEITRDKKRKKAMCRPYFFKFVGEGKNYKFVKKDTPMDYLEQIIDKEIPKGERNDSTINFIDLLISGNNHKSDRKQIQKIINKVNKLNNEINGVWASNMHYEDKIKYSILKKEKVIMFMSNLKISDETFTAFIYRIGKEYNDKNGNIKKFALLLLNILYSSHKIQFLNLFKKMKTEVEVIIEDDNCNNKLKIYEKTYKKSTKSIYKCGLNIDK
jgi:hypothetical protein